MTKIDENFIDKNVLLMKLDEKYQTNGCIFCKNKRNYC